MENLNSIVESFSVLEKHGYVLFTKEEEIAFEAVKSALEKANISFTVEENEIEDDKAEVIKVKEIWL